MQACLSCARFYTAAACVRPLARLLMPCLPPLAHAQVAKAISGVDGQAYALRRIDGRQVRARGSPP